MTVEQDWDLYKTTDDRDARDRLIVNYMQLVKYVASRVGAGLPQNVEQTDLASYGIFGLIDAIDKFDPARGFKFETYAIARIKGAILDELRSIDWVPRSVRGKHRLIENATRKLETELTRLPSDAELAAEVEMTPKQLRSAQQQISRIHQIAFEDSPAGMNDGEVTTVADTIADPQNDTVDDLSSNEDIRTMLGIIATAAEQMSEREQMVLGLYYYEGLTLAEIGTVLGVTESRVCQIHTKAVLILRERMIDSEYEPA